MSYSEQTASGHVSDRKRGKPLGPDAPHYPNKQERKELARICQKSGLNEEEVRKNKDLRIKLAKASKPEQKPSWKPSRDRFEYEVKMAKREIAKRLCVPVWHESVTKELNDRGSYWCSSRSMLEYLKRKFHIYYG